MLVRSADDPVVMRWSRSQAERAPARLVGLLAGLGLEPKAAGGLAGRSGQAEGGVPGRPSRTAFGAPLAMASA
ncbi:hypothetical protein [Nonomuraea sp. LPB2021202275-12-8]|uniref:hypothetical protein n=1 Tax=Nonomuraea sp. LPB2021202275-12-8 TaxID=3120159 RepID=UPI00300BFD50